MLDYDYPFFTLCLEELADHDKESIVNHAFGVRVAGADQDEWTKFINTNTPKEETPRVKKTMTKEDHMRNIQMVQKMAL